jgi:hypothetical protein
MVGKETTFPIVRGQPLVLWRSYEELGYMIDLFISKGENAIGQFNDYTFEDRGENLISATQDGLWTMYKYAVGDKKSVYVRIKDEIQHRHTYGTYVAWSTLVIDNTLADYQYQSHKFSMYCGFCGKDTTAVDMEYLAGTDHLECKLKDEMAIMNGTTC